MISFHLSTVLATGRSGFIFGTQPSLSAPLCPSLRCLLQFLRPVLPAGRRELRVLYIQVVVDFLKPRRNSQLFDSQHGHSLGFPGPDTPHPEPASCTAPLTLPKDLGEEIRARPSAFPSPRCAGTERAGIVPGEKKGGTESSAGSALPIPSSPSFWGLRETGTQPAPLARGKREPRTTAISAGAGEVQQNSPKHQV